MTSRLARFRAGDKLDVWGPLGNGFPAEPVEHLILVGGGIGQTPFLAYARESLERRQYGEPARSTPRQTCNALLRRPPRRLSGRRERFRATRHRRASKHRRRLGRASRLRHRPAAARAATGRRGIIASASQRIVCCGPWRMMQAVAEVARAADVPCWASLETPMACGIGICFSCVARIRDASGDWDYRRTCIEGPVFDANASSGSIAVISLSRRSKTACPGRSDTACRWRSPDAPRPWNGSDRAGRSGRARCISWDSAR